LHRRQIREPTTQGRIASRAAPARHCCGVEPGVDGLGGSGPAELHGAERLAVDGDELEMRRAACSG